METVLAENPRQFPTDLAFSSFFKLSESHGILVAVALASAGCARPATKSAKGKKTRLELICSIRIIRGIKSQIHGSN